MAPSHVTVAAAAALAMALPGAVTVLSTGSAAAAPTCHLPKFGPGSSYHPAVHPRDFSAHVTNPWFPLPVGRTYIYAGEKDGKKATDVVQVSRRTKRLDGFPVRLVNDRLLLAGRLEERTTDYYSQDKCGNVWYFGEDTAELDRHGHVTNTDGTWHTGVDGAEPGVFMQAHPQLDRKFRQEYYAGQAEDVYKALDKNSSRTVPYGSFDHALRTLETTRLEPGVRDNKYYVRGIGVVAELTVKGGNERNVLVDILR